MTHYQILNVSERASNGEIKAAYRKLIKQYHPDKNPSAEARVVTQQLNEAYEVLSDPEKRARYDLRFRSILSEQPEEPIHQQRRQQHYRDRQREAYRREYWQHQRERQRHQQDESTMSEDEIDDRAARVIFKIVRIVNLPVFIFCGVMLLDGQFYVTRHTTIQSGWRVGLTGGDTIAFLRTAHGTFQVPAGVNVDYDYENDSPQSITLKISPVLHVIKSGTMDRSGVYFSLLPANYNGHILWLSVFLLTSSLALRTKEYHQVVYSVTLIATIIFFLSLASILEFESVYFYH